jgi:hypothetical protein
MVVNGYRDHYNYVVASFIFILDGKRIYIVRYLQYWCQLAISALGGAYTKTPIDLSSGKEHLEIKTFNFKIFFHS